MRKILVTLFALSAAGTAQAADLDYDYLRGADYDPLPAASVDWSGFYIGGHGGYSAGALARRQNVQTALTTFANTASGFTAYSINPASLYAARGSNGSFGAYAGYNAQFEDVILGLEADYTHNGRKALWIGTAEGGSAPTLTTTYRASLENYGTFRARVGYAVGDVMPYVTAGVGVGEGSFSQALYRGGIPFVQQSSSKVVVGVAAGAGIEYAITPNVLLRAEYQYLNFQDFNGRQLQLNTVRGGAAVKF